MTSQICTKTTRTVRFSENVDIVILFKKKHVPMHFPDEMTDVEEEPYYIQQPYG